MNSNIIIQGFFMTGEPRFPVSQPSLSAKSTDSNEVTHSQGMQLKPGVKPRSILPHEGRAFDSSHNHEMLDQHFPKSGFSNMNSPSVLSNKNNSPKPASGSSPLQNGAFMQLDSFKVVQKKVVQQELGADRKGTAYLLQTPPPRVSGQPLPVGVQAKMESIFGDDFSDVRVHIGLHVSSIGALAYTHGSDIHFAPGQYNPMSIQGQRLLGHELTHVIQQRKGKVSNPFGGGTAVVVDHALESDADRMGRVAASGPPVLIQYMK